MDPTSGTATLLEITRVLGEMYKNGTSSNFRRTDIKIDVYFIVGFRPRRSLMFCSWGAEEYGLIGSVEYVQVWSLFLRLEQYDRNIV